MEFITEEMKLKNEAFEFISCVMKTVSFVMSSVTNEIFSIAYVVFFTFRMETGIVGMVAIIFSLSLSPVYDRVTVSSKQKSPTFRSGYG